MRPDTHLNLTAAQRVLLASAADRDDGACEVPPRPGRRPSQKSIDSLIEHRLIRQMRARDGLPSWFEDDDGRSFALIITKRGRDMARAASEPANEPSRPEAGSEPEGPVRAIRQPREGSKIAIVIALLSRETGAGLADLIAATGWLPHTTRAALTGLRKRGHEVTRVRLEDRGTVYRITNVPCQAEAA